MTKIIGHRGARGIELENSIASIRAALALDVDGVEFDVHRTSDGEIVVLHDGTTRRVADRNVRVSETTFKELQTLQLKNGQRIPTFEDILKLAGSKQVYIDIKDDGCAEKLLQILKNYPKAHVGFVSAHAQELEKIRELDPKAPTFIYFLKARMIIPRPIKMVRTAQRIHATGIAIDKLFLNPITYGLALHSGLDMYVYSVGTATFARLLHTFYPRIGFATGHPERLNKVFKRK